MSWKKKIKQRQTELRIGKRLKTNEEAFREGFKAGNKETLDYVVDKLNRISTLHEIEGIGKQRFTAILLHLGFTEKEIKEYLPHGLTNLPNNSQTNDELEAG